MSLKILFIVDVLGYHVKQTFPECILIFLVSLETFVILLEIKNNIKTLAFMNDGPIGG